MRYLLICFLPLLTYTAVFAQSSGKLVPAVNNPKAGTENTYYYYPPKGIPLPPDLLALVAYECEGEFYDKAVFVKKEKGRYSFHLKVPEKTALLLISMANGGWSVQRTDNFFRDSKQLVDNNLGNGYRVDLYSENGKPFDYAPLSYTALRSGFAAYSIQLNEWPRSEAIQLCRDAYRKHPELKNLDSYTDYLMLLASQNIDSAKLLLLEQAGHLQSGADPLREAGLQNAQRIYEYLKMTDEANAVRQKIKDNFPKGTVARQQFRDSLQSQANRSPESVLADMKAYTSRFADSSAATREGFYKDIIGILLETNQTEKLSAYEPLVKDTSFLIFQYNYHAWKKTGKGIYNSVDPANLAVAELLALKAGKLVSAQLKNPDAAVDPYNKPAEIADMVTNTYAAVLYKEGKYERAWELQHAIFAANPVRLDTAGLTRLAVYTEKYKGPVEAKKFLEEQFLKGVASAAMERQLKNLYDQLLLPHTTLDSLRLINDQQVRSKSNLEIIRKIGSLKAPEFSLYDLNGKKLRLSDFKNKIVVLDFWATWCGPCKAAFPAMKLLQEKFKNDSGIVFLFINTWESTAKEELQKSIAGFLKEYQYPFTVLLDEKNRLAGAFKLKAIPTKIIIGTNGNICFLEDPENPEPDISGRIEAERRFSGGK